MENRNDLVGTLVRIDNGNALVVEQIDEQCILLLKDGTKAIWDTWSIYEVLKTREELLRSD